MHVTGASPATLSSRALASPRVVAWTTWFVSTGLAAAGLVLLAVSADAPIPDGFGFRGFGALNAVTYATIGSVILAGRPANRVGWIFVAVGILSGILTFAVEYANVGLIADPGSLPGALWAAWVGSWLWLPLVVLAAPVFLLLFPEGHLLTPRWRWVLWLTLGAATVESFGLAFSPGPLENFSYLDNPLGLLPPEVAELASPFQVGLLVAMVAAAGSLVFRFRRAQGTERLQLKWVASAAFLISIAAILNPIGSGNPKVAEIAMIGAILSLPIAAGIAILRYRLYEIDLIINRALVYGSLTAILAGIYTASIALMQRLFVTVTGERSDAAIVLTTLVVVSAFTPIKNRLQTSVDRRFKEVRDPSAPLAEFVDALERRMWRVEPAAALRRLLEVATAALGASGGEVTLGGVSVGELAVTDTGANSVEPQMVVASGEGSERVALSIGPRPDGPPYAERDRTAVTRAVEAMARNLPGQA